MKECSVCGGSCKELGGGKYKCNFCGAQYSEEDFAPKRTASKVGAQSTDSESGVNVFDSTVDGVLEITMRVGGACYSGSGLLITRDGYGITNAHVIMDDNGNAADTVGVLVAGQNVNARVIGYGTPTGARDTGRGDDLALLKLNSVPSKAKVLEFADASKVRTGEPVFVIGNSLGYGTCITKGIVSDRRRQVSGRPRIMTDCAANGGNSGGPVFNEQGKVIGVHVASALLNGGERAAGMKYEIPSDIVIDFIRKYLPYFG